MALHIEVPTLIKIRDGIRVNVSLAVTHAIEESKESFIIKEEVRKEVEEGKRAQHSVTQEDYVSEGKADTVSFWFIGGTSVQYSVGKEIEQSDFDRIKDQLQGLEYAPRDRKPSNDKATQTA
jgi:hypothetical protein